MPPRRAKPWAGLRDALAFRRSAPQSQAGTARRAEAAIGRGPGVEWVRDNSERFGGDSGNVTIFGESGGGGKVSVLLAMPAASGLFHRAVIQSGAALRVTTREGANALAEAALKQLGITRDNLARSHAIPAQQLIAPLP